MEDPFGLLEVEDLAEHKIKTEPNRKRAYLWVTIPLIVTLFFVSVFFYFLKNDVSADKSEIPNYQTTIKLTGVPTTAKTSDEVSLTLSLNNQTRSSIKSGFVLVQSSSVDLSQTLNLNQNFQEDEPGYIRRLTDYEKSLFDKKADSGFYWYIGDLKFDQTKSQQIRGVITTGSNVTFEAKAYYKDNKTVSCGFLNLSQCKENLGYKQTGAQIFQFALQKTDKLKLKSGYNFISLPYVFTPGSISELLSSFKERWAYLFSPSTAEYLSLYKENNSNLIKPGIGFWVYDSQGGEYNLPQMKVETNPNETYTLNLDIGWNHLGNPYPKRMVLNKDKILVREVSPDESTTGTIYSLKTAIENGVISGIYAVSYNNSTDQSVTAPTSLSSSINTKKLNLDTIIDPNFGFLISSTKKVNLILPGKEIIAPGDLLTNDEKAKIERWITASGLNQYGDPVGTAYSGGTPLTDEKNGTTLDRLDYIIEKHPDRPWN